MRSIVIIMFAAVALVSCDPSKKPDADKPDQPGTSKTSEETSGEDLPDDRPAPPTDVEDALVHLERQIGFRQARGAETGGWIHYGYIAHAYLARGRLTGSLEDYVAAHDALEQGFEVAKPGEGPHLARAAFHLETNQIVKVSPDLEAVKTSDVASDANTLTSMEGDLALRTGKLDEALELYKKEEATSTGVGSAFRLGKWYLVTGKRDVARKWYDIAANRAVDQTGQRALAHIRQGDVDLGSARPSEAIKWYRKAEKLFDGWYLAKARVAEALLRQGKFDEAVDAYTAVYETTPRAEFAAAIASAHRQAGRDVEAGHWRQKARDDFERELELLAPEVRPEAIDFFLRDDPKRALELARAQLADAPGHAERVQLARALLAAGESEKSVLDAIRPTLDSAWATAPFLATAAVALRKSDPERATEFAGRAADIDPDAVLALEAILGE